MMIAAWAMSELAFRSWRCQAVLDREVDMEEP
jgi:hypothetical protein